MSVYAAFYKKKGGWKDWIIRFRTSSKYSHCEYMIKKNKVVNIDIPNQNTIEEYDYIYYSSSPRDGGVRKKHMKYDLHSWDYLELPWMKDEEVEKYFKKYEGTGYDWLGTIIGQGFAIKFHIKRLLFCSEFMADCAGVNDPWRWSPEMLYNLFAQSIKMFKLESGNDKSN